MAPPDRGDGRGRLVRLGGKGTHASGYQITTAAQPIKSLSGISTFETGGSPWPGALEGTEPGLIRQEHRGVCGGCRGAGTVTVGKVTTVYFSNSGNIWVAVACTALDQGGWLCGEAQPMGLSTLIGRP